MRELLDRLWCDLSGDEPLSVEQMHFLANKIAEAQASIPIGIEPTFKEVAQEAGKHCENQPRCSGCNRYNAAYGCLYSSLINNNEKVRDFAIETLLKLHSKE